MIWLWVGFDVLLTLAAFLVGYGMAATTLKAEWYAITGVVLLVVATVGLGATTMTWVGA